jgi:hypothetical protein
MFGEIVNFSKLVQSSGRLSKGKRDEQGTKGLV